MLTTREALAELQRLEDDGVELLGLDGFRLQNDGRYEAPIALILDLSVSNAASMTSREKFDEARRFVSANGGPHIRWEIVSGSTDE